MGGGITLALQNAASGLAATQRAMDVVAGNIANVNNAVYSRKHVEFESRSLNGLGAGVKVGAIQRSIDEHLLRAARKASTGLNTLSAQTPYRDRLQHMFGRPEDNSSLSHQIDRIKAALETLAATPERSLEHTDLVYAGRDFALQLNSMTATMQELRAQADKEIEDTVKEINRLTEKIDKLNDDIVAFSAVSRDTTDMQDDRDAALTELGKLIDVDYFSRGDGDVAVFTAKGATLVDKSAHKLTHEAAASAEAGTSYASGGFTGIYAGAEVPGNDITNLISGGRIKGLLQMRDETVPRLQAQVDNLAAEMRGTFNRIHNRGVRFPGLQAAEGTRTFIDPDTQTVQINAPGDTAIILFDENGAQQARTTLNTVMTAAAGPALPALADHGRWSITDVASRIQNWLRSNGADAAAVSVNDEGKFTLNLNEPSLNLAFHDQAGAAGGAEQEDVTAGFDNNGDGLTDETVRGFSHFLGLNDFFVTDREDNNYQSATQETGRTLNAGRLIFRNSGGPMNADNSGLTPPPNPPAAAGELVIASGMTLHELAEAITGRVDGVTAVVEPDGAGERLTFRTDDGSEFTVSDGAAGGARSQILSDLGVRLSETGISRRFAVRRDLVDTPSRVSRGMPRWDADRGGGEYIMSVGDGRAAEALAEALSDPSRFARAGGLDTTEVSFSEYAAQIVAADALETRNNERAIDVQDGLTRSLERKHKNESGVNLDEEMALLIVYEKSYAANARVISTLQRMFDALERAF